MTKPYTLGIDLGKNGGFCLLSPTGELLMKTNMPVHPVDSEIDHYEVEGFLARCKAITKDNHVLLAMEKVHGRAGNAAKAMYSFGKNNGYVQALVWRWYHRDIKEITPRTWQKWLYAHCEIPEIETKDGKRDTKTMAAQAVQKTFPKDDFRKSQRSINPHDGIVDAVGIALYSWSELNE